MDVIEEPMDFEISCSMEETFPLERNPFFTRIDVSHSGVACFFSKSNLSIFRVLNVFSYES